MAENLAKAHMKIAEKQDEIKERKQQQQEQEQQNKVANTTTQDDSDSDDDDNVFLSGKGCFLCGVSTHNTEDCKFQKIGAEMAAEAKRMVEQEEKEKAEAEKKGE